MSFLTKHHFLAVAAGLMSAPLSAAPLDSLAKKLASGAASLENKRIAVLTFPYHDEKISSGSTLVSERLTTSLVEIKGLRVLERNLIGQLLKEKKLSESGVIDQRSLKAIGKILDSEAIVTGTLIDLPNDMTEINARLIRTDTGEVLSAGQSTIDRTWDDAPCDIIPRPVVSRRANVEAASEETDAPVSEGVDEPVAKKSLSGKSLKLSNESFPPGHRRYLANEPSHPVTKRPLTSSSYWDDSDDSGTRSTSTPVPYYYYRPVTRSYGYNGTDGKPLPPPMFRPHYPLGTFHYDNVPVIQQPQQQQQPSDSSK